jgi:asparagine N-glycosylation enzyme membrane subunit Stt3
MKALLILTARIWLVIVCALAVISLPVIIGIYLAGPTGGFVGLAVAITVALAAMLALYETASKGE